jgi:hypothetical protein
VFSTNGFARAGCRTLWCPALQKIIKQKMYINFLKIWSITDYKLLKRGLKHLIFSIFLSSQHTTPGVKNGTTTLSWQKAVGNTAMGRTKIGSHYNICTFCMALKRLKIPYISAVKFGHRRFHYSSCKCLPLQDFITTLKKNKGSPKSCKTGKRCIMILDTFL